MFPSYDLWMTPHDDVIKWKHFPRYWPFVRGIHRPPVNSPHKGQWRGALMFSLICIRINGLVNNGGAGDLIRYRVHYDVIVMHKIYLIFFLFQEPDWHPNSIHREEWIRCHGYRGEQCQEMLSKLTQLESTIKQKYSFSADAVHLQNYSMVSNVYYFQGSFCICARPIRSSDNDSTGFWSPGSLHTLGAD